MKNWFNKLVSSMKNSSKSPWGGLSSSRITGYFILCIVMLFAGVFLGIEIGCAIVALWKVGIYHISNEAIIIFGSLLTHHLSVMGINKKSETVQLNNESKGVGIDKKIDGIQSTSQVVEPIVQDVPKEEPVVQDVTKVEPDVVK